MTVPLPPGSRILVVDDNASLGENIAECLEAEGYAVSLAADGRRALMSLADEPPPAAVLLDLLMPGMTGRELVQHIRADPRLRGVRLVLMTGHPSASPESLSVDAFLPKPFGVDELLSAVAGVSSPPRA
jgi:two-component system chemotaxis response regulator CheY